MATTTTRMLQRGYVGHSEKATIYHADAQGIDVDGLRYAVVCDVHGEIVGDDGAAGAELSAADTTNFCQGCRDEDAANARLIAAAPDMLAALQELAEAYRFAASVGVRVDDHYNAATRYEIIVAAIAKATGE